MNNKYALNLGLILAAVSVILFLLNVVVDGGMIFGAVVFIISLAATIAFSIFFLRKKRKDQGGLLTFGDGFLTSFLGLMIAGVITILFTYVYANFIDAGYIDETVNKSLEMSMGFMEGNVSEDMLETQMEEIELRTREGFTAFGMLKSFGFYVVFYAILALIFGASLKKNPEESIG